MLRTFKDNNINAIEQNKDLSRDAAKNRAFDCILNTKMLANKIMAQILKKENGGRDQEIAASSTERFTYDAEQFEIALEEKFKEETFQKNREIKRLQEQLAKKEESIGLMRSKLESQVQVDAQALVGPSQHQPSQLDDQPADGDFDYAAAADYGQEQAYYQDPGDKGQY